MDKLLTWSQFSDNMEYMHKIQEKILILAKDKNLAGLTLRGIGDLIDETGSPQKIKHHLAKLIEKGLLATSADGKTLKAISRELPGNSGLISLPIYGSANCGQALIFADEKIEAYLKVSPSVLGQDLKNKINKLFVLVASGQSMNRVNFHNRSIEDGDYIIIEQGSDQIKSGDLVVSIIDGMANIKKFIDDRMNNQIILVSESSQELPPIYIHRDDNYSVAGKVVEIIKKPDELRIWQEAAGSDVVKNLGEIPQDEYNYYKNLK